MSKISFINHTSTTFIDWIFMWNINFNEKLKYNLYDLNSCISKIIIQFKKNVKNIVKLNALVNTFNYIIWNAFIKMKLVDAQCWDITEKYQIQNSLQNSEWALFWNIKNHWVHMFITNFLYDNVRLYFVKYDENWIA